MNLCIVLLLISFNVILIQATKPVQVQIIEKIKTGLRTAKSYFTLDHAAKVAKLVSQALGKSGSKGEKSKDRDNLFSGFMRLFGFDTKKVGAIAVNAIIVVAQLISSAVSLTPPSQLEEYRSHRNETPLNWMLNNEAASDLISSARDQNLSQMVMDYVKERSLDEDTGCIQLLICKSSIVVKKMQEAINKKNVNVDKTKGVLYAYFPTVEEFGNHGEHCKMKHPYCTTDL